MTYLNFLIIFVIPLLSIEVLFFLRTSSSHKKNILITLGALTVVALVYTTPWDNYLVKSGIWSYSDERVLGKIGYVPYEEYAFFILQTWLTGIGFYFIQRHLEVIFTPSLKNKFNAITIFILFLITLLGIYSLFYDSTRYLGLILAWATPVILLQWIIGGKYLLGNFKLLIVAVTTPTLYLWTIDTIAIHNQVWLISEQFTTGFKIFKLPVEEALFFLVTNIMIIQGLILSISMKPQLKWFKLCG